MTTYRDEVDRIQKRTLEKLGEFAPIMYLMLYDVINSDYFFDYDLKEDIDTLLDKIDDRDNAIQELKPCPFCGSKAELQNEDYMSEEVHRKRFIVICKNENCRVSVSGFNTREHAINYWNTRKQEDKY